MADLQEAFNLLASKFGIQALNSHQQLTISKLIGRKKDVFVNMPTGFGKSLVFQALLLVIDHVSSQPGHICVVVSPLLTLVDDQVEYLRGKGVTAARRHETGLSSWITDKLDNGNGSGISHGTK